MEPKIQLASEISGDETLYRVVKRSRPDCITEDRQIAPALFKDENGVSVDRDGVRDEAEAVRFITEETFPKRTKAITSVTAARCFELQATVEAAPSELNPFHANIYLDEDERKGNLQALQLADACRIVYFNESVAWT